MASQARHLPDFGICHAFSIIVLTVPFQVPILRRTIEILLVFTKPIWIWLFCPVLLCPSI